MFAPGDILDNRYEILAPLAEGGMGAVYRARRTLLGDEVAIKIVLPDLTTSTARERFLRESRLAASLRHPAVVSIFDFDMPEGGQPYLVMELLTGPSLREEIRARGRLDAADVQHIIPGIAGALHQAHANGIVHRDIKPANIVAHDYMGGGRVYKLVDFGVANLRQTAEETRLTGADQFIGTVAYASPEQLAAGEVDARSDVYSLAAVVFEALAGHAPFPGPDVMAIVSGHLTTPVPRLRTIRPDVPDWLEAAVTRGLAKKPADRWQTAAEFGDALRGPSADEETRTSGSLPLAAAASTLSATYDIGDAVGPGRLGSRVFRATHRALGHPVAIRILDSTARNWSAVRERFLREARALQVAHPSIMQVRDYGEESDFVYLVTDFVEGVSLRALLREGAIAWPRLRPLLQQLLEAVRVLHRRKALICGLNPDIMRVRPGNPAEDEEERILISTGGIWTAQDLLATLADSTLRGLALEDGELRYVAPELLTGGTVDVRSDIFTIGVLAYEMATGRPPFDGKTMPELLGRMLSGAAADPRSISPELPEATASAILRALRPSPNERFASVKEFAAAVL